MKVYIDVSNLTDILFLSGIQRVVREVVLRMIRDERVDLVLLFYDRRKACYEIVDNTRFENFYLHGIGKQNEMNSHVELQIDEMEAGSIFFDIDGIWHSPMRRSYLLPKLKARGVRVAVYIYDIIPVTHPQFSHQNTVFYFMNYLGAHLQYADYIMVSAQSTLDEVYALMDQLGLPRKPGCVTWLGSDYTHTIDAKTANEVRAQEIREQGAIDETKAAGMTTTVNPEIEAAALSGPFVLMVGTIEPRKNHRLILDAFDQGLFADDVHLIFAGRVGWNVEEFKKRIDSHKELGKKLFHIDNATDVDIEFLYEKALCLAFPSYIEGFGLPIIEAIEHGTPVIAGDCKVSREVGREFCEYCNQDTPEEFISIVRKYLTDESALQARKEVVKSYVPFTWDETENRIVEALQTMIPQKRLAIPEQVDQMVILSARMEDLLPTLPFVENFMPFIKELVLCCPDKMVEPMKEAYTGRLAITYVTDSMLLQGRELPKDHSHRNYFLRCLAMEREEIHDVFIMSDDDYRPLLPIDLSVFIKDGRYQGYYCYDLEEWKGTQGNYTSFDYCMLATAQFARDYQYPSKMYASHMPQIIDKRVFKEMLKKHPGIEETGADEWGTYFNYLQYHYPMDMDACPFVTLGWPGAATDWDMQVIPKNYLFENYYQILYEDGRIFDGFSKQYHEGILRENIEKITRYHNRAEEHEKDRAMYRAYQQIYRSEYQEEPPYTICEAEDQIFITLPEWVAMAQDSCTRIMFRVHLSEETRAKYQEFKIAYFYTTPEEEILNTELITLADTKEEWVEVPVRGIHIPGEYRIHFYVYLGEERYEEEAPITMLRRK